MGTLIAGPVLGGDSGESQMAAWHLAALLLSAGRPTRPADLASRCTLFAASSELVEFLCSIPNSPILLTADLYVTLSAVAFIAVGRFISETGLIGIRGSSTGSCWWNDFNISGICFRKRKRRYYSDCDFLPAENRIVNSYFLDVDELDRAALLSPKRICNDSSGIHFQSNDNIIKSVVTQPIIRPLDSSIFVRSYFTNLIAGKEKVDDLEAEIVTNELVPRGEVYEKIIEIEPESDVELASPSARLENPAQYKEAKVEETFTNSAQYKEAKVEETFTNSTNINDRCKDFKQSIMSPLVGDKVNGDSVVPKSRISNSERVLECKESSRLMSSRSMKPVQNMVQPSNTVALEMSPEGDVKEIHNENCNQVEHFKGKQIVADVKHLEISTEPPSVQKFPPSPSKLNRHSDASAPNLQGLCKTSHNYTNIDSHEEKQLCNRYQASLGKGLKKNSTSIHIKERKETSLSLSPEDQKEPKVLPTFESYIVEEEEGSGGYGIVYKARRKKDGATVAIKCPHARAHGQHVTNELKVLERFGGKNFIIKYEGSFKNGNTDCFVLEHIEHDRPEVLRREIDVFQIRWYGYCMFKALASLHRRGIIHRDVKPGNFLFSRKLNKGYLIDFNLAKDLHQNHKNITSTKCRKFPNANISEAADQRTTKGSKTILDLKDSRRKVMVQSKTKNDRGSGKVMRSQGADGSGVTSAKDATSTRTSFAEKLRKTLPSQGRKELINFLQETLLGPNQEPQSIPAPMRKRIPAPRGKVESELLYVTPMPLNSTGVDVTGAGFLKNKGNGNHMREGSCVGTKGFRAPEVLFKSPHQGPKLDIWSAGVSLLYLIIGRTPFTGDPEQNLKDIAKLRGSEDLWEVAKLHNRESSFPVELYDKQSLPCTGLRDWCLMNTKRPEFLEVIPGSLFDLVDKCLAVNPRVRISSDEALRHEFFAPCHESLRMQRLSKQAGTLELA